MLNIVRKLKPAHDEVRRAAHTQDLVEAPRRAKLDRAADGRTLDLPEREENEDTGCDGDEREQAKSGV
jgi:hypothetical protein